MTRTTVSDLMAEVIAYGGCAGTRAQVYSHALDCCRAQLAGEPDCERRARRGADSFAFSKPPATPDQLARLCPWEHALTLGLLTD